MAVIAGSLKAVARRAGLRRGSIAALRMQAEREFLATTAKRHRPAMGRILCYHSVGTEKWGVNDVTPEQFISQIEIALQLGYEFVPAATIAEGRASADNIAITFDDALLSVATNAAPVLADYGIPWTLFVVTTWADGRHGFGDGVLMDWSDIERLADRGVEIGSHSLTHPDFGAISAPAARHELVESRRLIEARTGIETQAFAIPLGQSNNWSAAAHSAALEAGYELIYAQSSARRPSGTVPRTFIARCDDKRLFAAAIEGAFDGWEEWV